MARVVAFSLATLFLAVVAAGWLEVYTATHFTQEEVAGVSDPQRAPWIYRGAPSVRVRICGLPT